MATLHKEYHPHPLGTEYGEIKMYISFDKDLGRYRATVVPVKRTKGEGYNLEESGAFTGFNDTLIKFDRQSSKRLEMAIRILHENKEKYLDYFKEAKSETNSI